MILKPLPILLQNRISWFGNHSGYEQLTDYLKALAPATHVITPKRGVLERLGGKAYSLARPPRIGDQGNAWARCRLEMTLRRKQEAVGHILYGEEHLMGIQTWPQPLKDRLILTFHQPRGQWQTAQIFFLNSIKRAMVLYQGDIAFYRANLHPEASIHFIPYGVDIEFFQPFEEKLSPTEKQTIRLLYSGVHLRNTRMLARIVPELLNQYPNVVIDFLVPEARRNDAHLEMLMGTNRINWYAGLDDGQLRALYQKATALLLPMNDSGANTAVVEALACGLPVITTDVGGIRDYGGGSVYPVVANDDDEGMLALVRSYLDNPSFRDEVSRKSREFAVRYLSWDRIAIKHMELYRKLLA